MIDIHTHILPGVDDGARNFDESVEIIKWLSRQGVTNIIATPHFINETDYISSRNNNLKILDKLRKILVGQNIKTKVFLGNEIYIDPNIDGLIKTRKISPLADSKYILVELPINGEFPNYEDYLFDLMQKGYKVILAHPERYVIVQEDFEVVENICNLGVYLQCNIRSILGHYGKDAERVVRKLAKEKMIFAFASDTHRVGSSDYITMAQKKLSRYYNERELSQVLTINPGRIWFN